MEAKELSFFTLLCMIILDLNEIENLLAKEDVDLPLVKKKLDLLLDKLYSLFC